MKVSIVVPTYKTPEEGLARLIASLDAQTMPAEEFEVIFLDDGSPDDTVARVRQYADARANHRVVELENTGWPSHPRNVGTDMATGEYVLYMDHDDTLFPDGLRAAWQYAHDNGADCLNGKEARTHDATWGIGNYTADIPNARSRKGPHPLLPMNPHKLYRREFLNDHGIRFREGGRVFWEDIFFNLKVDRYADVISTLSSVPFYHWWETAGSGSKGFKRTTPEFWHWLREIFVAIDEDLAEPRLAREREQMLLHQYRKRILGSFTPGYASHLAGPRRAIFDACRTLQAEFIPPELDEKLTRSQGARAVLLRRDDESGMRAVASEDAAPTGAGTVAAAEWRGGTLHLRVDVDWTMKGGKPLPYVRRGERIMKSFSAGLAQSLGDELLDVTAELGKASAALGIRERATRLTWMIPSESQRVISRDETPTVSASVVGELDPATAAFGGPLARGAWDLNVRASMPTGVQQPRVSSRLPAALTTDGRSTALAYANADGFLTIDIDQGAKKIGHAVELDIGAARREKVDGVTTVRVPVLHADVRGEGSIPTTVRAAEAPARPSLWSRLRSRTPIARAAVRTLPARLMCAAGVAEIVFRLPEGWQEVEVVVGDRENDRQRL